MTLIVTPPEKKSLKEILEEVHLAAAAGEIEKPETSSDEEETED